MPGNQHQHYTPKTPTPLMPITSPDITSPTVPSVPALISFESLSKLSCLAAPLCTTTMSNPWVTKPTQPTSIRTLPLPASSAFASSGSSIATVRAKSCSSSKYARMRSLTGSRGMSSCAASVRRRDSASMSRPSVRLFRAVRSCATTLAASTSDIVDTSWGISKDRVRQQCS